LAHLRTANSSQQEVKSLGDFLRIVEEWQTQQETSGGDEGFLSQLWYRGVNQQFPCQVPGVYRKDFTNRAEKLKLETIKHIEGKRLHLEREMLAQFRSAGAPFLQDISLVELYFAAQHFGMPTRLLDWSTNPLAALFFACVDGQPKKQGVVYAMDARKVIPPDARITPTKKLYQAVMTMRHPFVKYAVELSFWHDLKRDHHPYVLPVRPDIVPGRIGQQGSCFTLHMHNARPVSNETLITIVIDAGRKKNS
jgi:FRG domain